MFQLRLKGILSSFKGALRVFERSLIAFQEGFKGISRKIEGYFKGDLQWDYSGI